MAGVNGSMHRQAVSQTELFLYSVGVFQIILFMFKFAVCFLFLICLVWLLGWRRFSR